MARIKYKPLDIEEETMNPINAITLSDYDYYDDYGERRKPARRPKKIKTKPKYVWADVGMRCRGPEGKFVPTRFCEKEK